MALTSDTTTRILVEVVNGQKPSIPDDDEMKIFREDVTRDVVKMRADGKEIDIAQEVPSI